MHDGCKRGRRHRPSGGKHTTTGGNQSEEDSVAGPDGHAGLALYAPAALTQDDGYGDDSDAPLPSTGGSALLPIAGAALLLGASFVGIGAALKRPPGR